MNQIKLNHKMRAVLYLYKSLTQRQSGSVPPTW